MRSPSSFRPFDAFRPLRIGPTGPRFRIGALFANSELGGYYPIRPKYLYEDSAGTTPAAVDGVVGLQFDQAQRASLGDELIVNGTFDDGTDGWNSYNSANLTTLNEELTIAFDANFYSGAFQVLGLESGKTYRVSADLISTSGAVSRTSLRIVTGLVGFSGTVVEAYDFASLGRLDFLFVAPELDVNVNIRGYGVTSVLDNISVREIKGHHALQATTANKPYLRQTPETQKYWLDGDTATAALNVTFPESLGANCTVARVRPEGVEWLEAQTIGTTYNLISPYAYNSDTLIIDRALTLSEKAQVERMMQRSDPGWSNYGAVFVSPDATIFSRIDSPNGPYELTFIGSNGVEYKTTANNATTDVGAQGLTAPVYQYTPKAVTQDEALTHWYCYSNQLTGTIPDLSTNTALEIWYCNNNQLTGTIPDLSANTALTTWYCQINQLTGTIPDLSANTALRYWRCHSNQLTGTIPDLSANTALRYWRCNNNQLTGTIPDLSANTALTDWYCQINQFTGTIPDLSANTALEIWICYNNQLTGWDGGTISATCTNFQAHNNALNQAAVDGILQALDAAGASNSTLKLEGGTNAAPSAAGLTAKSNLETRGWTVTVNS